ncbi:MAG: biotin synthase BioB [Methanocalculaceae archaeon]|jgi:biotin synthase|nr:biotin synthase BioB [Methanocalculaceae archaeon]
MELIPIFKEKVLGGGMLTRDEALLLAEEDTNRLAAAADEIRKHFCGDIFDLCTIINGKNGGCTEDCIYCAQSMHHAAAAAPSPVADISRYLPLIAENYSSGAVRCGIVTSGRMLTGEELAGLLEQYRLLHQSCGISLCASHGLLTEQQLAHLKGAGVVRYHANLETSRRYFPQICTTHTYDDKIAVIKAAQCAGLEVCSGGIFGLGETIEDRIDMALDLRALGIRSVPINILTPIPGTPLENAVPLSCSEVKRIVALYRFLLPDAYLRLAGGRGLLPDRGCELFLSGANAAISGDMLTTAGVSLRDDQEMIRDLGFVTDEKKLFRG